MKSKYKLTLVFLITTFLLAVGVMIFYISDEYAQRIKTTSGDGSPAVGNINGDINITIGTDSTGPRNKEDLSEKSKQ